MIKNYRTFITETGFGLEQNAKFTSTPIPFGKLVIGDGILDDGLNPSAQTDLIHQVKEYGLTIEKDIKDPTVWIGRAEIPANDGGFHIHEAGIKTSDGYLYCYARQPGDYKPMLSEGMGKSYTIRLKFIPSNADIIEIKIDPSVQFATPTDLKNEIKKHNDESDPHKDYLLKKDAKFLPIKGKAESAKTADNAVNSNKLENKSLLEIENEILTKIPEGIPIGIPFPWPNTTPPTGWFECRGQSFDKTIFTKLAIAYPYGILPDLRGEFIRGWDNGRGVDVERTMLSAQLDAMQGHRHFRNTKGNSEIWFNPSGGGYNDPLGGATGRLSQNGTTTGDPVSATNNGTPRIAIETRSRNIAFMYIVKAE